MDDVDELVEALRDIQRRFAGHDNEMVQQGVALLGPVIELIERFKNQNTE